MSDMKKALLSKDKRMNNPNISAVTAFKILNKKQWKL